MNSELVSSFSLVFRFSPSRSVVNAVGEAEKWGAGLGKEEGRGQGSLVWLRSTLNPRPLISVSAVDILSFLYIVFVYGVGPNISLSDSIPTISPWALGYGLCFRLVA